MFLQIYKLDHSGKNRNRIVEFFGLVIGKKLIIFIREMAENAISLNMPI